MMDDGAVWLAELHGGPQDGAEKRLGRFTAELWFPYVAPLTTEISDPADVAPGRYVYRATGKADGRDIGHGLVRVAYTYVGVKS